MVIKGMRYKYTGDEETLNMPPKAKDGTGGKLPDEVIKDFEKWVKSGRAVPQGQGGRRRRKARRRRRPTARATGRSSPRRSRRFPR